MKILVVGAGAIGGYFGGRLLESGQDVTFLVRKARAQMLARDGLQIRSPAGDASLASPPTVQAGALRDSFDLIILSCKAYHLQQALEDMAPAVGAQTVILPLLNGMQHLERLDARFGAERVLGGLCVIPATVGADGIVRHLGASAGLSFGERDGSSSLRVERIAQAMANARFDSRLSTTIVQDMWNKWVFLATLAGSTCLMRAPVGNIVEAPGGEQAILDLLEECRRVAEANGYAPGDAAMQRSRTMLTEAGSTLSASMLRDLEQGSAVEADHVIGDLLARGETVGLALPMLCLAYTHLKAYEARRGRLT
ncbi:2-dehydropantoate 2-reductase [Dyella choica]|uniref:2-dehydropantoate 2-reductase n=1 Tax=Dyella choica TaxID=1927959 RepID=A0A432MA99_9GAMM|nr:2-dehydropantoate 2-reductase [Dyella choica]RUL78346.1 2-dehydropantoate 2-reductase [Dyella choica]